MQCIICRGELIEAVSNEAISGETNYEKNFYTSCKINKFMCLECGFIHEFATNPRVFTDIKYKDMGLAERSKA